MNLLFRFGRLSRLFSVWTKMSSSSSPRSRILVCRTPITQPQSSAWRIECIFLVERLRIQLCSVLGFTYGNGRRKRLLLGQEFTSRISISFCYTVSSHDQFLSFFHEDWLRWSNLYRSDIFIVSLTFITSVIIYGARNMSYIDALLFGAGAATQSGLNPLV